MQGGYAHLDSTRATPRAGFADPVMDSQSVFRTVMMALAEPGLVRRLDAGVLQALEAPPPLSPASAAILLALTDYETPVWLDAAAGEGGAGAYLTFHTGCRIVAERSAAGFAVVAAAGGLAALDDFAAGSLEYPDRSATLVVEVAGLADVDAGPPAGQARDPRRSDPGQGDPVVWRFSGPGIANMRRVVIAGLDPALLPAVQANRARFPRGIDLIFVAGQAIVGLPRSTDITGEMC